jgi:hypothetical protein
MKSPYKQNPGDLWRDADTDTTFVLLSADRSEHLGRDHVWRAAAFYDPDAYKRGWYGAAVKELLDEDFARMRFVGTIPTMHTFLPSIRRRIVAKIQALQTALRIRRLKKKFGEKFWENSDYWREEEKQK